MEALESIHLRRRLLGSGRDMLVLAWRRSILPLKSGGMAAATAAARRFCDSATVASRFLMNRVHSALPPKCSWFTTAFLVKKYVNQAAKPASQKMPSALSQGAAQAQAHAPLSPLGAFLNCRSRSRGKATRSGSLGEAAACAGRLPSIAGEDGVDQRQGTNSRASPTQGEFL